MGGPIQLTIFWKDSLFYFDLGATSIEISHIDFQIQTFITFCL